MRRIACRRQFSIAGTPTPVLSSADYLLWVAIFQEAKADTRGCDEAFFFIDEKWWNYQSKWTFMKKTVLSALFHMMQQSSSSLELELDEESLLSLASSAKLLYLEKWKGYFKTILFIGFNLNTHASTIAAYLARKLAFLSLNLVFLARRKANRALAASRRSSRSLW